MQVVKVVNQFDQEWEVAITPSPLLSTMDGFMLVHTDIAQITFDENMDKLHRDSVQEGLILRLQALPHGSKIVLVAEKDDCSFCKENERVG